MPLDDEPVSEEEAAAITDGEADRPAGIQRIPFDDIGCSLAD